MYASSIILKIQNYINENLTNTLTLEAIAEEFHFSPYWLSRLYHRDAGETVMGYVRKQRLRQAVYDLLNADCSITEIAMKYGYDSPDAFTRVFRGHYGMSPKEYKQSRNPREEDVEERIVSSEL